MVGPSGGPGERPTCWPRYARVAASRRPHAAGSLENQWMQRGGAGGPSGAPPGACTPGGHGPGVAGLNLRGRSTGGSSPPLRMRRGEGPDQTTPTVHLQNTLLDDVPRGHRVRPVRGSLAPWPTIPPSHARVRPRFSQHRSGPDPQNGLGPDSQVGRCRATVRLATAPPKKRPISPAWLCPPPLRPGS